MTECKSLSILSPHDVLWKELDRWGLGWDGWFRDMSVALQNSSRSDTHPPYNIFTPEENRIVLEIAVAGYDPKRIAVTQHRKSLTVSCATDEDSREYAVRGIARRPFVKHFTLGEWVRVESAEVVNGLLTIQLVAEIPEEQKPKQIPVKF